MRTSLAILLPGETNSGTAVHTSQYLHRRLRDLADNPAHYRCEGDIRFRYAEGGHDRNHSDDRVGSDFRRRRVLVP